MYSSSIGSIRSATPLRATLSSRSCTPASCKILYVTPEMSDFVKVGGLGDVSAALPRALRNLCDVRVLIPGYRQVLELHPILRVVGRIAGLADIPPCEIAEIRTADD